MAECTACKGSGVGPVGLVMIDGVCQEMATRCFHCCGRGTVPEDHAERVAFGQRSRERRRAIHRSLGEEARRLGLRPSELSAIEHGTWPGDYPAQMVAEDEEVRRG